MNGVSSLYGSPLNYSPIDRRSAVGTRKGKQFESMYFAYMDKCYRWASSMCVDVADEDQLARCIRKHFGMKHQFASGFAHEWVKRGLWREVGGRLRFKGFGVAELRRVGSPSIYWKSVRPRVLELARAVKGRVEYVPRFWMSKREDGIYEIIAEDYSYGFTMEPLEVWARSLRCNVEAIRDRFIMSACTVLMLRDEFRKLIDYDCAWYYPPVYYQFNNLLPREMDYLRSFVKACPGTPGDGK